MRVERISIELTNACGKGCWFCYNQSGPGKATTWSAHDVERFVRDCAAHGVQAVSFGGGEPLEYPGFSSLLRALDGVLFRSCTTNGLLLDERWDDLLRARPDKVHVSIHFPDRAAEVERVVRQVQALEAAGVRSGVNLLVARSKLAAAQDAAQTLRHAGIGNERIVYLPMRGEDTPLPEEVGRVAGGSRFQSTTCLRECRKSERFLSIGWDRRVAWCSYTAARAPLAEPTWDALVRAQDGLGLTFCGGTPEPRPHALPVLA